MSVIIGIESSCDETSAAVSVDGKIVSNVIATQKVHEKYGGVVPELASRAHQQNIVPVIKQAIEEAQINKNQIDAIGFTQGPGLLGSLLVGGSFAKGMAMALDVPLIPVHHMKAHILSHFIDEPKPAFPFLCLTVSGGHTQIVLVKSYYSMEVLGETLDDAAGEAFDKAAKIMGLPYPGGPEIDRLAVEGNSQAFKFSKTEVPDLNYSFSGIKTSFLYFLRDRIKADPNFIRDNIEDISASIQHTLVHMLLEKLGKASIQTGIKEIAIAGGVSANSALRNQLTERAKNSEWNTFIPKFEYCTDNAAMIAIAGHFLFEKYTTESKRMNEQMLAVQVMPRMIF